MSERKCKQEFLKELPMSPASGKFYMKHKIMLFQKINVWLSGLYDQIMINARPANATMN
jgi:hypothetical protein